MNKTQPLNSALRFTLLPTKLAMLILLFLKVSFSFDVFAERKTLTFAADVWCPYTCLGSSNLPGYMVEALELALSNEGYYLDYQVMPWSRALAESKAGRILGVIGTSRTSDQDILVGEIPLGVDISGLVALQSLSIEGANNQEFDWLDPFHMAVIQLDHYDLSIPFERYLQNRMGNPDIFTVTLSGDNPIEQMIGMLLSGRVDVISENIFTLQYALKRHPKREQIKILTRTLEVPLYIGVTNDANGAKYLGLIEKQLEKLRTSMELQKIMNKYGVSESDFLGPAEAPAS